MSDTGPFSPFPSGPSHAQGNRNGNMGMDNGDWIASLSDAMERGLSSLCSTRWRAILALMLFALICFLPGFNSIPPVDRDEARFAQASKQMIETGDYIDIRFQDGTRYKKPVGIYWMQVAGAKLSGLGEDAPIWAYRLPSLIGALAAVGLTFLIGMRMASVRVGFLAGLAMAAAILLGVEARLAKTDAMLLATILVVQWLLWELYDNRAGLNKAQAALFWLALAIGVLVKGPIILMVAILTIIVLSATERSLGWLKGTRWLFGLPLFLLVVLPWYIAIGFHTDWAFYIESVGKDMLGKVAEGKESHGAPPGVYLGASIGTFWPASVFFILSCVWLWHERGQKAVIFLLSWALPTWLIFELVPTKLPHYILPCLPALAILAAKAMDARATSWESKWGKIIALLIPIVAIIVGLGAPIGLIVLDGTIVPAAFGLGLVAAGLGMLSYSVLIRGRVMAAFLIATLLAPVLYLSVHGTVFPSFSKVWLSNRLVEAAHQVKACEEVELSSSGYNEPSLVFLGGTDLQFIPAEKAATFIIEAGCRVAIVEKHQEDRFKTALGDNADKVTEATRVEGYKLNGGKWQSFGLYLLKM